MARALILGASRGIGLELVRQYLADGWDVSATARGEADCARLAGMGAQARQLDVTDPAAIAALAGALDGQAFDAVFLNAGVFGPRHEGAPTEEEFDQVMHTNVLAAMRLLPVLAPMVARAGGKLAVLSSIMGSNGARDNANATLYRASKAALNSVLTDTALRYGPTGATCIAFHPGWVRTEMGGAGASLDVEESVEGMRATLAQLDSASNGEFLNYDGAPLPW